MDMERLQLVNLVAMGTRKNKVLQLEAMMTTLVRRTSGSRDSRALARALPEADKETRTTAAKAVAKQTDTTTAKKATDQQAVDDADTTQRMIPREATQTRHQAVKADETGAQTARAATLTHYQTSKTQCPQEKDGQQ